VTKRFQTDFKQKITKKTKTQIATEKFSRIVSFYFSDHGLHG